jgi:hypothetical protein
VISNLRRNKDTDKRQEIKKECVYNFIDNNKPLLLNDLNN